MSEQRNPKDWFGLALGIGFAIGELRSQITPELCQNNPRLVCLAISGLQHKVDAMLAEMKIEMSKRSEVTK